MEKVSIIVAAGSGSRMKSTIPKQFLMMQNKPILMHTIEKFIHFDKIILVIPESNINDWSKLCEKHKFSIPHKIIKGGHTRFSSVKNGLNEIHNKCILAIHDGVRPNISKKLISKLISSLKQGVGVVPVIPINDSLRKIKKESSDHVSRENLFIVQTPQIFHSEEIKAAYQTRFTQKFTDDASVFQKNGGKIKTIAGTKRNLKITTSEDLEIAVDLS